ncbi:MAG: hypothetical protein AAB396_00030 [Patescibacteria group bacterium]
MYNFILQIIIMSSLGIIVYLFGRAIPRISNIEENITKNSFQFKLDKFIAKIPFDKIDISFSTSIEKTLRKIKLLLMKWDNIVTNHIEKMRKTANGSFGGEKKEEKQSLFVSSNDSGISENKSEAEVVDAENK